MLQVLDVFFTVFHTGLVLFILIGWYFESARKYHQLVLLLTLTAWLIVGLYIGTIGYCPLTDWHWDIKRALGETGMSSSFVGYMLEEYLGIRLAKIWYDIVSAVGLVFGVLMATYYKLKTRFMPKHI